MHARFACQVKQQARQQLQLRQGTSSLPTDRGADGCRRGFFQHSDQSRRTAAGKAASICRCPHNACRMDTNNCVPALCLPGFSIRQPVLLRVVCTSSGTGSNYDNLCWRWSQFSQSNRQPQHEALVIAGPLRCTYLAPASLTSCGHRTTRDEAAGRSMRTARGAAEAAARLRPRTAPAMAVSATPCSSPHRRGFSHLCPIQPGGRSLLILHHPDLPTDVIDEQLRLNFPKTRACRQRTAGHGE